MNVTFNKASNRYQISSRPSYERADSRNSFVASQQSQRDEQNSVYMDTDGTDLQDFLLNEQLIIIQSTVGDNANEEDVKMMALRAVEEAKHASETISSKCYKRKESNASQYTNGS